MNLKRIFSFGRTRRREFIVTVYGKELKMKSQSSTSSQSEAQAYAEKNAVICADCGKILFPGRKVCFARVADQMRARHGILVVEDGLVEPGAAVCLDCSDPLFMCGEIAENRSVIFFQSPLDKTLQAPRQITVIPDIQSYRG